MIATIRGGWMPSEPSPGSPSGTASPYGAIGVVRDARRRRRSGLRRPAARDAGRRSATRWSDSTSTRTGSSGSRPASRTSRTSPATSSRDALARARYRPSTEPRTCAGFDVAVITVPTPLREGVPDLSLHRGGRRDAGPRTCARAPPSCWSRRRIPGTTEELVAPMLEDGSGLIAGADFHLGYSPERIDPGNPTWNSCNTRRSSPGIDADVAARGAGVLRHARRHDRAGLGARARPS